MRNAFAWGLMAALWAWCFGSTAFAQKEVTIEAIESAWKEYSKKLSNVQIKWEIDRTAYKGSVTRQTGFKGKNGEDLPPTDHRHVARYEFSVSGFKARLDSSSSIFNLEENSWRPVKRTSVFDGKNWLSYDSANRDGTPWSLGTLAKSDTPQNLKSEDILPILHWIRPLDPDYSTIKITSFNPTGVRTKINGSMCDELRRIGANGGATVSLWLDPKRNFMITRKTTSFPQPSNGRSGTQEDAEYEEHATNLWTPRRWSRITFGGNSSIISKIEGRVDFIKIDSAFDEGTFEALPPPRTVLVDYNEKGQTVSIVRENGQKEQISDSKISSAIKELDSPPRSWISRHRLLLPALAFSFVFITGSIAYRYRLVNIQRKQ